MHYLVKNKSSVTYIPLQQLQAHILFLGYKYDFYVQTNQIDENINLSSQIQLKFCGTKHQT